MATERRTERRVFTDEFKREAVRLATERGNLSETARQLGLNDSVLSRWKHRLAQESKGGQALPAFPGSGNARDAEVARLQRENNRLQEENEILKKAVGIFTSRPK